MSLVHICFVNQYTKSLSQSVSWSDTFQTLITDTGGTATEFRVCDHEARLRHMRMAKPMLMK